MALTITFALLCLFFIGNSTVCYAEESMPQQIIVNPMVNSSFEANRTETMTMPAEDSRREEIVTSEASKSEMITPKEVTETSANITSEESKANPMMSSVESEKDPLMVNSTKLSEMMPLPTESSMVNHTEMMSEFTTPYNMRPSSTPADFSGYDDEKSSNGSRFSCYGRSFGQYADVGKNCHIFHLCYPYLNISSAEFVYQRISFLCNNNSVFDQKRFVCVDDSTMEYSCQESPLYYESSNENYLNKLMTLINGVGPTVMGSNPSVPQNHTSNWLWSMFNRH